MSLIFGRRYGLVGRNGIGKTTLIKMLSRYGNYTSDMKYLLLKKSVFIGLKDESVALKESLLTKKICRSSDCHRHVFKVLCHL